MTRDQILETDIVGLHISDSRIEEIEWDNAWPIIDAEGTIVDVYDSDDLEREPEMIGVRWTGTELAIESIGSASAFAHTVDVPLSANGGSR